MAMISAAYALKEVTGGLQSMMMNVPTGASQSIPMQQQSPMMQPAVPPTGAGFMQPPSQPSPQTFGANDGTTIHQPPQMTRQTAQQPTFQPMQQQQTMSMPPAAGSFPPTGMQGGMKDNSTTPRMNEQQFMPPTSKAQPEVSQPRREPSAIPKEHPQHPGAVPKNQQPPLEEAKVDNRQAKAKVDQKKPTASTKKQQPQEEEYEPSDSAMTYMILSLFSLFFSMAWFVVKIPFRIGSMIFTFWVAVVALKLLWLFFADDGGAWEMGAGVDYEYNMPGIY